MKNVKNIPMKVSFYAKSNPNIVYAGVLLLEDGESCVIGIDFQGTEATIVCYYDKWEIIKLY